LALEYDVGAGPNAVQQRYICFQAQVVHIAEHRHHRCNPASSRNQNNAPVLALVEAELAKGAVGFDRHSNGRPVVQKYRGTPLAYTFWRNLDVTRSDRRGTDRIGPDHFFPVEQERKSKKLAGARAELPVTGDNESQGL